MFISELIKTIELVKCALPSKRSLHTALGTLKLKTVGGNLTVSASDWDIFATATVTGSFRALECSVDTDRLLGVLKSLSFETISIVQNTTDELLEFWYDCNCLAIVPYDEHIDIDMPVAKYELFEVDSLELATKLSQYSYAAAQFDTTSILRAVCLTAPTGRLEMVATDGSRLAHFNTEIPTIMLSNKEYLVPAMQLKRLLPVLKKLKNRFLVSVSACDKEIIFEDDNLAYAIKLQPGQYPNYGSLFPRYPSAHTVNFDTKKLLATCKQAARKGSCTHVIYFDKTGVRGELNVTMSLPLLSKEVWPDDMNFACNLNYLADICKSTNDKFIELQYDAPFMPLVCRTSEGRHLLMPVQVKLNDKGTFGETKAEQKERLNGEKTAKKARGY